jgi:hypothetical protein
VENVASEATAKAYVGIVPSLVVAFVTTRSGRPSLTTLPGGGLTTTGAVKLVVVAGGWGTLLIVVVTVVGLAPVGRSGCSILHPGMRRPTPRKHAPTGESRESPWESISAPWSARFWDTSPTKTSSVVRGTESRTGNDT